MPRTEHDPELVKAFNLSNDYTSGDDGIWQLDGKSFLAALRNAGWEQRYQGETGHDVASDVESSWPKRAEALEGDDGEKASSLQADSREFLNECIVADITFTRVP